jgi:PilZ domain
VSAPAPPAREAAPLPERGTRVLLDGLPGGPWTSVVEGLDGSMLAIAPPRLGGKPVALPLGLRFVVAYASREVPCEVDAELVERPAPGGRDTYTARLLGEGRRMQRRSTVRVSVHLIVQASLGGQKALSTGAITENLSAGGALLRLREAIEVGASLTTTVLCGGHAGVLEIEGRVVRCDRVDAEERPFRVAIAFADMPRSDEDRLVRFIFERQREMRRRTAGLS